MTRRLRKLRTLDPEAQFKFDVNVSKVKGLDVKVLERRDVKEMIPDKEGWGAKESKLYGFHWDVESLRVNDGLEV